MDRVNLQALGRAVLERTGGVTPPLGNSGAPASLVCNNGSVAGADQCGNEGGCGSPTCARGSWYGVPASWSSSESHTVAAAARAGAVAHSTASPIQGGQRPPASKADVSPNPAGAGMVSYCVVFNRISGPLMADPARTEPHAPLVWANVLMFTLTLAAAAILVPWYGVHHGFTVADWAVFVVSWAPTAWPSPPATTGCGRIGLTRRTGACGCCTWCSAPWRCRTARSSGVAATAPITCTSTTWTTTPTRPARLLVLAHRLDAARLPERPERTSPTSRT